MTNHNIINETVIDIVRCSSMSMASDRMKELRVAADLKQYELADILGMKQSMLSYYENGREAPHDVLSAYMKYFDVSADYLLGVSDEKKPVTSDLSKHIIAISKIASAEGAERSLTSENILLLLNNMRAYYKAGAPAGNLPMETLCGFVDSFSAVLDACTAGDTVALLDSVNAVGMTVLDVQKILTKFIENTAETSR